MTERSISEPLDGDARTAALRNANACRQMAELCDALLGVAPELTPRAFLRSLGALVAGIDLGLKGFEQLARGGANGLVGAGFKREYDDGTAGQARHFAGTAAAAALLGDKPAELLAHHVVDPAESIDGHLSTAALEFARLLIEETVPLADAGRWIEAKVCDPAFEPTSGFTPFDVFGEGAAELELLRARFSESEWRALVELPERVAVAAALADATADLDDMRDVIAGMRGLDAAAKRPSVLVRAVTAARYDEGFAWGDGDDPPGERVEQTLYAVSQELGRLRERGIDSAEIDAYASLLLAVANAAVRGSISGGVFGIGGQRVSEPERRFLDRLEETLECSLPGCDGCLS